MLETNVCHSERKKRTERVRRARNEKGLGRDSFLTSLCSGENKSADGEDTLPGRRGHKCRRRLIINEIYYRHKDEPQRSLLSSVFGDINFSARFTFISFRISYFHTLLPPSLFDVERRFSVFAFSCPLDCLARMKVTE